MAANTAVDATSGENLITRTTADGLAIEMAKNIKVDSVTAGDTLLNNSGLTIKNGPSISVGGINMGDKQITNLASAGDLSDAKNVQNAVNVGDLNKGLATTETTLTTKGMNFAGNSGESVHRDLGQTLAIKGGMDKDTAAHKTSGENLITRTTADGLAIEMARDIKVDSVTAGNTIVNNAGVTVGKDIALTDQGLTIKNGPSMTLAGIDAGNKKITNVAPGVISDSSKDAINGSQLNKSLGDITNVLGGNAKTENGNVTMTNVGNTGKDNIHDAIDSVNIKAGQHTTLVQGDNIEVTEGKNAAGGKEYTIATAKDLVVDSVTAGDTVVNHAGLTIKGGPSITVAGIDAGDKKITNVAPGEISDTSKDAINGSQLNGTINNITNILGGKAENKDGQIIVTDIGGTGKNTIDDAIKHVNSGWDVTDAKGNSANIAPTGKVTFLGDDNVTVTQGGKDQAGQITVALNKALQVESIKGIDNNPVNILGGLNITGGNMNMGGGRITNVAAGVADTDAVNVKQLNDEIGKIKWHLDGDKPSDGGAVVKPGEGTAGGNKPTDPGTKPTDPDPKPTDPGTKPTDPGTKPGTGNGSNPGVGGGNTIVMKGENNIRVDVDGDTNTVTIGTAGDGKIASGSKDVVTGGQLYDVAVNLAENTKNIIGGKTKVTETRDGEIKHSVEFDMAGGKQDNINDAMKAIDNSAVHYDKTADGKVDKSKVTLGEKGKEVTVGNVAAGVKDNDAVNVSQLKGAVTKIDNQFNEVHQNIGKMNQRIDDIDKDSRAGVAAAMAAAGLPQAYLPGKSMMAIAGSTWRGETGYAIGVSTISDNGNWVVKANMSGNARSQYGASAGVGYQW